MSKIQMRRMFVQSLCFVLALAVGGACHARAKVCSRAEAEAADAAVDSLDSWTKMARAFKKYGHCDDGSIAEGNSEAVARLLVDHWAAFPVLAELVKRDPALKQFVLRHIDTTLDTDDLSRMITLASLKCPRGSAPLCSELLQAAQHAFK